MELKSGYFSAFHTVKFDLPGIIVHEPYHVAGGGSDVIKLRVIVDGVG
jgi:hypothetical protein